MTSRFRLRRCRAARALSCRNTGLGTFLMVRLAMLTPVLRCIQNGTKREPPATLKDTRDRSELEIALAGGLRVEEAVSLVGLIESEPVREELVERHLAVGD